MRRLAARRRCRHRRLSFGMILTSKVDKVNTASLLMITAFTKKEDECSKNNLVLTPSCSTGLISTTNDTNGNDNNKKNVVSEDDDKNTYPSSSWSLAFDVKPFDGLMSQILQNTAISNSSEVKRRSAAAMAINFSSSTTMMESDDRRHNRNSSDIHLWILGRRVYRSYFATWRRTQ
jgi:hypothetical protein